MTTRSKQWYTNKSRSWKRRAQQFHRNFSEDIYCMRFWGVTGMGQRTVKRRPGKQWVEGKTFRLADEVRYMQRRVAEHASRIVTIGQLVLFSTDRGRLVPGSIR